MRRFQLAYVVATLIVPLSVEAQCSDGTPLPCRSQARVDTNAFVVLPFAVSGPPTAAFLGASMVDLFHMALDGVARIRVEYAPTNLRRLGQLSDPRDVGSATGVALEIGAGRVITGTVVALGSDVRIRAEVFDVLRSKRQFVVEGRATMDNVAAVVDSLAAAILARRLVPRAERDRINVGEYATKSAKALQAYLVARQHSRRGERRVASDSVKSALRLDPDFGLAYLLLHRIESAHNGITGMTAAAIEAAARQRSARFPERVRVKFDTLQEPGNRLQHLAKAQANVARFPDDPDMAFYLADQYFHHGLNLGEPSERVIAAFRRAIALDDQDPELLQHFETLMTEERDSTASWAVFKQCHAKAPDVCFDDIDLRALFRGEDPRKLASGSDSLYWGTAGNYLIRSAKWDPALGLALTDSFAQIQTATSRSPERRNNAYVVRSTVALARGQYELAWAFLDSATAAGTPRHGFWMLHNIVSGTHEKEVAAIPPLNRSNASNNLIGVAIRAWWSAVRQPADSAEQFLRLLETEGFGDRPLATAIATGLRGLVALRTADTAKAIDYLVRARPGSRHMIGAGRALFPAAALALLHAQIESARGNHARAKLYLADVYPNNDYPAFLGDAEELRAKVALALGDTATAKTHLKNVIGVWDKADPPLQPRVGAARATLARLENR
jgi:tetratricopeptide (TPR) repeat protein